MIKGDFVMDILKKLDEAIQYKNESKGLNSAQDLMSSVKKEVRKRLGEAFFKAAFDKTTHGDGIVFFKASKCSFKEATNEDLEQANHLIVAVEGFDSEGNRCEDCGSIVVETVKYKGGNRMLRKRKCKDLQSVKEALVKYFEKYEEDFKISEMAMGGGTTSGAVGTAGAKAAGHPHGTQYIPNGSGQEGSSKTVGSVAVKATRNRKKPLKRGEKK